MPDRKKISLPALYEKYARGEPITMLTCYDYPTAACRSRRVSR